MRKLIDIYNTVFEKFQYLDILALLAARLYVAWVFFKSGLTKLNDWDSTLLLFEYEYAVPVLDHVSAAYLATAAELIAPVFLAIGLFTRKAAFVIFIVNYVAVLSLEDIPDAALNLHYIWGLLLLANIIWGAGLLSADKLAKIK